MDGNGRNHGRNPGLLAVEKTFFESEERFRVVFDSISDGVFIHDPATGAVLDVNRRACEMWGYSRPEMLEMEVGNLILNVPPYDRKSVLDRMGKASYVPQIFEWRYKNHGGQVFWAEASIRSDVFGKNRVVVASLRDINHRKDAELKRLRATAHLEILFRSINDSICLLDPDGVVLHANPAMCRQLACTPAQMAGKKCCELMHGSPCHIPDCLMQRMLESRQRESLDLCEGNVWVNITTDPVFDEKGGFIGTVHMVRDITLQKLPLPGHTEGIGKIQALNGLLPICACCKNIRAGDGNWIQIEAYIETYSDARFTHGICPNCARKLYPNDDGEQGESDRD